MHGAHKKDPTKRQGLVIQTIHKNSVSYYRIIFELSKSFLDQVIVKKMLSQHFKHLLNSVVRKMDGNG